MKNLYEEPEFELIKFTISDVILASVPPDPEETLSESGDDVDDPFS